MTTDLSSQPDNLIAIIKVGSIVLLFFFSTLQVDLQVIELLALVVVVGLVVLHLLLGLRDSCQKSCVCLLSSQELVNYFLNVGVASAGLDLLKAGLDGVVLLHLELHLGLEEGTVQLLNHKALSLLYLILVLVLISSQLGNLTLSFDPVHSSLECFFFVLD